MVGKTTTLEIVGTSVNKEMLPHHTKTIEKKSGTYKRPTPRMSLVKKSGH